MEGMQRIPEDNFVIRRRFQSRRKLLRQPNAAKKLAEEIRHLIESGQPEQLRKLLDQYYPADLADVMETLSDEQDKFVFDLLGPEEAAEVLDELDSCSTEYLARSTAPDRLAKIVSTLPADETADILEYLPPSPVGGSPTVDQVLSLLPPDFAVDVRFLMTFPKESAGGIMSLGFVAVLESATVGEAVERFKQARGLESIFSLFVVDARGILTGIADLHVLLSENPDRLMSEIMVPDPVFVYTDIDQEVVARIFARYDLNALPVVSRDSDGKLVGVVTADDIIDVIEQEFTQDLLRMAGSDAQEMERTTPARIALLRLPWIMATMFIELLAGFVIHFYDQTLAKVLLLASFMPIISAISGNTGLQSATIIVRGLSAGTIRVTEWGHAVLRQLTMTMILGAATGATLGVIGAIWYGKWVFGLVIFVGMFAAVNIAGIVGTIVPLTSKRLGFDPAITSGPFETAFQDVVGISIFLTLATVMLRFLVK